MNWRFWNKTGDDDCAAIEPLLSLYSDGMAPPREARRVEAHLPDCPDCQQALAWMQATRRVIARRPALTPPADLRARIARAIAEADAAKAPPVKAPAAPRPPRPVYRPLALRPALAGLSLVLAAGLMADVAWNAAHPNQRQVATRPPAPLHSVPQMPAPQVASNIPETTAVISGVLGHVNETLHSALVAPPTVHPRRLSAYHAPASVIARVPAQAAPPAETVSAPPAVRLAANPRPQAHPPLSHRAPAPPTLLASKPPAEHPAAPVPKPIQPTPRMDNPQVATANVPPVTATPAPVQVRVDTPPVTHNADQVAGHAASLHEVLYRIAANMQTVGLTTSKAKALNKTNASIASIAEDISTDRSGIAAITSGPVR